MNGRERGTRYRIPTPYLKCCTRQRKVYVSDEHKQRYEEAYDPDLDHYYDLYLHPRSYLQRLRSYPYQSFSLYITMLGVTNATPMDIFQDDTQGWNDQLNAAVHIFKEQMDMILEARNDVARCQHIIAQQNTQIANLQLQAQGQGAGPSTAQPTTSTSLYSKKVEIFNDPGEYDRSKVKFEEWWAKMQAWLTVNQHEIPASLQDAVGAVLSQLKGLKASPFA